MICSLTGELREVDSDRVRLACGPMVYEILVPAADALELQSRLGQALTLHTIFDLEGDANRGGLSPRLMGFLRAEDKRFFELFITVKGIGPKTALQCLKVPAGQIAEAIESRNTRFLMELPKIGKRMAEQIVAALAGKMKDLALGHRALGGAPAARNPEELDAIDAATQLGVPRLDAERLLDRAKQANPKLHDADTLLREMLRLRTVRA